MQAPATHTASPANVLNLRDSSGRVVPNAVEIEGAVLGAMLLDPESVNIAESILPIDAFYLQKHRRIYSAFYALSQKGEPIDVITTCEHLKSSGHLDFVGGLPYLNHLVEHATVATNTEYYARILCQKAILRKMIEAMGKRIMQAYDPSTDAFELLDQTETDLFQLSENMLRKSARNFADVCKDAIDHIQNTLHQPGCVSGVASGFSDLDKLTGGWQNSDLIILAGRPSMGKTAFALACAKNAAMNYDHPIGCAFFSLEMSAPQLAQRVLMSEARINAHATRMGGLQQSDFGAVIESASKCSKAPIFIDDTAALTVLELRAKCRRLVSEHGIGLVVVDYLQLMQGRGLERREEEVANISRSLKALAKELDLPVIALSQLNRNAEDRKDKRPQLSDLRESGAIEQDADIVAFIYRAAYYGIREEMAGGTPPERVAEIIIGKNRNGPTGTVKLDFVREYGRFSDLGGAAVPDQFHQNGAW